MNDPFHALRRTSAPIAPDPAFANRLRRQLAAALTRSTTPSTTTAGVAMTVTPYLTVNDAAAAIEFYRAAFGAVEQQRLVGDDGRVGHAELMIGTSLVMLSDEYPEMGVQGPLSRGGATCAFTVQVADVDASFATVLALGATALREPADQFYGDRSATIADPFGHRWTLSTPVEQLDASEYAARSAATGYTLQLTAPSVAEPESDHQVKHHDRGDLYYFSLPVTDLAASQRFFGATLGWNFADPTVGHISNISAPPGSLGSGGEDTVTRLWFVVDDIHSAVASIRDHGGTATEPVFYESGWAADCTDPTGVAFSISVPTYTMH